MNTLLSRMPSLGLLLVLLTSTISAATEVQKPRGVFSSSGATGTGIYGHPHIRGVLVRTAWATIEPQPGVFDFSHIEAQVNQAEAQGVSWSLAVSGGSVGAPDWLMDTLGAPSIAATFRGQEGYRLPLFWHATVQERLGRLAAKLAEVYGAHDALKLVYIPQMTSNGVEGHLQGVDMSALVAAGYTDERWILAARNAAGSFAAAFPNKALAFEVHEVNGGSTVPIAIINALWNDPVLEHRVGAGMWWISGKTSYQPDLVAALIEFSGDIYGQVIGRSDQTERFEGGDYTTVFAQAREVGMRYIEPWEYEFKREGTSANGAWDEAFAAFNAWADQTFADDPTPVEVEPEGAPARIVNLSVRSAAGQGADTLIMGFVIGGTASADVLIRGIGPGLSPYGITDFLPDPQLRLFNGSGDEEALNDRWGGAVDLAAAFGETGAFALDDASADAAILETLPTGAYSAHLGAPENSDGVALIEIYDRKRSSDAQLINVSTRTVAGHGDAVLVAGFVLEGDGPRQVLIRGVGPSLVPFGVAVASVLADPMITLFQGQTILVANDNWGGAAGIETAFAEVGAFAYDSATSLDAAILVDLDPGTYSVHLAGPVESATPGGVALVEIYAMP